MNVARNGHMLLNVNGEPTVIGGHTTNFVPTPTAEYYKDGAWHLVQLAYSHDDGCAVELSTGKVLIAGGHERELGVGQTFAAELYDPVSHTTKGFGSLHIRRSKAVALPLDSGRAVITGNWYHYDAIEMYDGDKSFVPLKGPCVERCSPLILRTAKDNAIIVSNSDTVGEPVINPVADRLQGDPFQITLPEQWQLVTGDWLISSQAGFIGDEAKGDYSYLLMVKNDQGQIAIVRTSGEEFQLLSTDVPIPMNSEWGEIWYNYYILADRQRQRAYLLGMDVDAYTAAQPKRIYIITIDYASTPAHLTRCYTDKIYDIDYCDPILTDDGNLMLVGGIPSISNFEPSAATWLLHVNPQTISASMGFPLWGWGIAILAAAALAALGILLARRKKSRHEEEMMLSSLEEECQEASHEDEKEGDLMKRIYEVIEEKQLYLNPNLKVADIAIALNTNRRAISDCINAHRGTFRQFVNTYRVAHAQELLRSKPDITITDVWMSSGFSSESSFFRIFKAATGDTPKDWKDSHAG